MVGIDVDVFLGGEGFEEGGLFVGGGFGACGPLVGFVELAGHFCGGEGKGLGRELGG